MSQQAGFYHTVFFWLRDGGGPNAAQQLAQGCRRHLTGIPGILHLSVGVPAGTERAVVDNSYGVALLVEFADRAAHDIYQEHPDHQRFIQECSPLWERVQIYDAVPAV